MTRSRRKHGTAGPPARSLPVRRRGDSTQSNALDAVQSAAPGAARWHLLAVVACFFLSGFAALLYQTAWLRQFSTVFGTSELAVASVLAAYMAGLAIGAAVIGRYIDRVLRPVLIYGLLEAGIAISALAVPLLVGVAGDIYVALLGGQAEPPNAATFGQPLFYLIVTLLVVGLPTGFMGATLPLLARYAVRSDREMGPRLALLYALNTAGAVVGTLVAAFALLPAVGLRATVWTGVAVNGLVFALAWRLSRARSAADRDAARPRADPGVAPIGVYAQCLKPIVDVLRKSQDRANPSEFGHAVWILPLICISGANAFLYEVLWTRLLTHVIGASVYAFATMLSAFLTGIAIGGGLIGKLARDRNVSARLFAIVQIGIALLAAGVYVSMDVLIPESRDTAELAAYAFTIMLPATLLIGATFPLAVRILARNESEAGIAAARIFSWNTAGALVGAVGTGFLVIPAIGFEGTVRLAVVVNLSLALWTALFVVETRDARIAFAAACLLAFAFVIAPGRPDGVLSSTGIPIADNGPGKEVYFGVGRSATVLLTEIDGRLDLRTNGLPEASALVKGAPEIGQVQRWLTGLPIAARPGAETMLVVGVGAGVALEDLPASLRSVDVIELEPEVMEANRRMSGLRASDPLGDARINVVINDARNALRLTGKSYDIFVSQPSHPWTAGASHLYTREFVRLAKSKLNPDGVFLQWVGAGFLDIDLFKGLARNLVETYANVRLYQYDASMLFFLASDGPLNIERRLLENGAPLLGNLLHFSYLGLNGVDDFVAALVLDEEGTREVARGALAITDDRNRMATQSRRLADGLKVSDLVEWLAPWDPLIDADSWIHRDIGRELDFEYIASSLLSDGFVERAAALARAVDDPATRAFITGLIRGSGGRVDGVVETFEAALAADPGSQKARYALLEPQLPAFAAGRESAEARALAGGLNGSAAAVVRGWMLAGSQDWRRLADLDRELARADPHDLWYPEAVQLRADWRLRLSGDARSAFDAMRLVDRALVIRPKLELFVLRAAAADRLGDDAAYVETCRYALSFIRASLDEAARAGRPVSQVQRAMFRRQLTGLRAKLDGFGGTVARANEVAESITELLPSL